MTCPRLLDVACKAGGCSAGYHMAGFVISGVDIEPQPNYPFEFWQGDFRKIRTAWVKKNFQAIHLSPPCQIHSVMSATSIIRGSSPVDLIPDARALAAETGLPYIIENVVGAPLDDAVMLCGSSFGLRVRRHRKFETNFPLPAPPSCNHWWQDDLKVYPRNVADGKGGRTIRYTGCMPVFGDSNNLKDGGDWFEASVAMGINWMNRKELAQAIPPVYTYWVGRHLMEVIR